MDNETILQRRVAELRSLLDLSYARERGLVEQVQGLLFLLEGAACAPDRQERVQTITDGARAALGALAHAPVPNHGLFADYARLAAEFRAAQLVNATLNGALNNAQGQVAAMTIRANDLSLRVMEADAQRDAVAALLSRPDLVEPVTTAARDLARARAAAAQPRSG